jgi:hypothetical protein
MKIVKAQDLHPGDKIMLIQGPGQCTVVDLVVGKDIVGLTATTSRDGVSHQVLARDQEVFVYEPAPTTDQHATYGPGSPGEEVPTS